MSAEEQHRDLGKVPSLVTWDDLVEEVKSLRDEIDSLNEQLNHAGDHW